MFRKSGGGGNCTRVPGNISGACASLGDDLWERHRKREAWAALGS